MKTIILLNLNIKRRKLIDTPITPELINFPTWIIIIIIIIIIILCNFFYIPICDIEDYYLVIEIQMTMFIIQLKVILWLG